MNRAKQHARQARRMAIYAGHGPESRIRTGLAA